VVLSGAISIADVLIMMKPHAPTMTQYYVFYVVLLALPVVD
jgi:hypothetical protein